MAYVGQLYAIFMVSMACVTLCSLANLEKRRNPFSAELWRKAHFIPFSTNY